MEPLDLRSAPPRSARAELAGIVFLPRSIDKLRASLPGGELGEYNIEGFTELMFEKLGIDVAAVTAVVADAADDGAIGLYVTERAKPGSIAEWNDFALNREIFRGDRAAAIAEFPWLADLPEMTLSLDFLNEDDRRSFANLRRG
jgi:hypothetical protein